MDKTVRKRWTILIFVLSFVCIERLCHLATDGFSIRRIQPPASIDHRFASTKPCPNIYEILDQPFYYLASGSQSFTFISKDGQCVLKFFKVKPGLFALHKYRKREKSFYRACQSCLINKKHFKAESAILCCHLRPSEFDLPTVVLHGPAGSVTHQQLNDVPFVLQKHIETIDKRLLRLKTLGDKHKKERTIDSLLELMVKRYRLGYSDKDPNWILNFGFCDDRVVAVDVGGLIDDRPQLKEYFLNHELDKAAKKAIRWLKKNDPELIPYVVKKVADIKSEMR